MCHVTQIPSSSCGKSPYPTQQMPSARHCSQGLLHLDAPCSPQPPQGCFPSLQQALTAGGKARFRWFPGNQQVYPRIKARLLCTGAQDGVKAVNPAAHQSQAQLEQIRPCTWDAPRHQETARTEPARLQSYIPRDVQQLSPFSRQGQALRQAEPLYIKQRALETQCCFSGERKPVEVKPPATSALVSSEEEHS